MSLNPEDSRRRGRSKSPGRRDDRDRSRSRAGEVRERSRVVIERAPSPPSVRYQSKYNEDDDYERNFGFRDEKVTRLAREEPRYVPESAYRGARDPSPPGRYESYGGTGNHKDVEIERVERVRYADDRKERGYHEERKSYRKDYSSESESSPEQSHRKKESANPTYSKETTYRIAEADPRARDVPRHEDSHVLPQSPYGPRGGESPPIPNAMRQSYAEPKKWEYAQAEEKITYKSRSDAYVPRPASSYERGPEQPPYSHSSQAQFSSYGSPRSSQTAVTYDQSSKYTSPHSSQTTIPGAYPALPSSSREKVVTVEPGHRRTSTGTGLAPRMSALSVSSPHGSTASLAMAPGSPLLEAYHGTYQSISPMPSPLLIASTSQHPRGDADVLDFAPLSPGRRKRARFHDPESDAAILARALKGNKDPDTEPLIEILPALTHSQIMDLRVEYKKMVKTGSEKKGVNIAKHIKLRLKEADPSLMKACYAVALGKWESEAYWANFWYQGEKSRRELLIESLMGRTNAEIRAIKDGFSDKKYSNSLTKCMKTELKEDKFKKAVLLVLEERRMEDTPYSLDHRLIEDDVRDLYRAVKSERGGESAIIGIVVLRSDSHLREVLKVYEATFRSNFAREVLKKSRNLVVRIAQLHFSFIYIYFFCVRNAQTLHDII